jgi:CRP-like cAMP-binding protein
MNSDIELLKGLPSQDASDILALGTPVLLASGHVLFEMGARAESIYLVRRGRIALTLPLQIGGRGQDLLVDERLPGQAVGWSGLIAPHRFTLKASAPLETEVLALPRQALLDHFATRPALGYAFITNVATMVGQRLQLFEAMWLREIQRAVELRSV